MIRSRAVNQLSLMSSRVDYSTTIWTGVSITFCFSLVGCGGGGAASEEAVVDVASAETVPTQPSSAAPSTSESVSGAVDADDSAEVDPRVSASSDAAAAEPEQPASASPELVFYRGYQEGEGFATDAEGNILIMSQFEGVGADYSVVVGLNQQQYLTQINEEGVAIVSISPEAVQLAAGEMYDLELWVLSGDNEVLSYGQDSFIYESDLVDEDESKDPDAFGGRFEVITTLGSFTIELYESSEEIDISATVSNFIQYVESGAYEGTVFHRVMPGFVVQGGGFDIEGERTPTDDPIELETGYDNAAYTVAMARTNDPDSATNQFYINHADNGFLNATGEDTGYAVFGIVTEGREVVDAIAGVETASKDNGFTDWPIEDIVINSVIDLEDIVTDDIIAAA